MQETWVQSQICKDPTAREQPSLCATTIEPVFQSLQASTTEVCAYALG